MTPGSAILQYHVLEKLGQGGMGVVYKARDTRLNRFVALKQLPPEQMSDPERCHRFVHEAQAASALNHPNIITIHDIIQQNGADFIVMEYIDGRTLDDVLAPGRLEISTALKYGVQIADALAKAHAAGIVHRDVKPGNIMVSAEGLIKVLDFGLAKQSELASEPDAETLTLETAAGQRVGTLAYMSPEQADGKKVDARADVFSYGAVLYQMITGRRAFHGSSPFGTLLAIVREQPRSIRDLVPEAPPELEQIVVRCLRKDPDQRFDNMAEVKRALERIGHGEKSEAAPSVAVLPFANLSADKENEYFSDGLAEEIINALAHVPGLRVAARMSSFAFRGKEVDVRKAGEVLSVSAIVEGSVRRAGNRIRVTAQLISVADGYNLWSERYDREMADIFDIQDEMAQAIVESLKVKLVGPRKPLVKRYTDNIEAYRLYLEGRYHHLYRLTPESMSKAEASYKRAIALDPEYAPAYVGLADLYVSLALAALAEPNLVLPKAKAAVGRALQLDNTLAEAHSCLGQIRITYEYDWEGAQRSFKRALELSPASAEPFSRYLYAYWFLWPQGRLEEALSEVERMLQQDPLSPLFWWFKAYLFHLTGRYDVALEQFRKILELEPNYWPALIRIAISCAHLGLFRQALEACEKAIGPYGRRPIVVRTMATSYAMAGKTEKARKLLEELHQLAHETYVPASSFATVYTALGENDRAFEWLARAVEEHDPLLLSLTTEPCFDSLRPDPRYAALLRKIHLERQADRASTIAWLSSQDEASTLVLPKDQAATMAASRKASLKIVSPKKALRKKNMTG
ncbi:MAG: hypothetical protein DMG57_00850 [Acidobacteria bacterium]|nr:MAG: hypothetical protein DMG57_00850 [Acidobacteriota bacterium]